MKTAKLKLKVKQLKSNNLNIHLKGNMMQSEDAIYILLKVAYEYSSGDKELLLELQRRVESEGVSNE